MRHVKAEVGFVKGTNPSLRYVRGASTSCVILCHSNHNTIDGAGVDILTTSFWADSLSRQKYAWVVIPTGGTEWVSVESFYPRYPHLRVMPLQGLDWHGPSAADAFLSVSALSDILSAVCGWRNWGFNPDTRVVLMGHSNGGQGVWYMAARWPDRVCGGAHARFPSI